MKLLSSLLLSTALLFAAACDEDETVTPTATPQEGTPAATVPAELTATSEDGATPIATVPPVPSIDAFSFPSLPESPSEPALLTDVRVGEHPEERGFDRIVFEFEDVRPAGMIEYSDEVTECGSGESVDPEGSGTLFVHFDFTNAHNEAGELTIDSTTVEGPGNSILEAESTCDFEAIVEWAIGVDGEQPFTVSLLEEPARVVIDVAH